MITTPHLVGSSKSLRPVPTGDLIQAVSGHNKPAAEQRRLASVTGGWEIGAMTASVQRPGGRGAQAVYLKAGRGPGLHRPGIHSIQNSAPG